MSIHPLHERGTVPVPRVISMHPHPSLGVRALDRSTLSELRADAAAHFWPHARPSGDLGEDSGIRVVLGGHGVWVEDADGRQFLDTLSGMWLNNVGHGRREIAEAVYRQMCMIGYTPEGTVARVTVRLAARIAAFSPDTGSRVFFVSGGSEGVETALKMARKYHRNCGEPGRHKFISRRGSYHGATLACLSLGGGGSNNGVDYGPLLSGCVRVQGPDQYRPPFGLDPARADAECAHEIERAILNEGPETVAAVIGEPISASAGVHIPGDEYWPMVRAICDRYGVLLIADEVITGFGRTGRMFATEHWGVVPDITVVAKALTSGYVPIGAVIAAKHVADAFGDGASAFDHRFTFGGNPVACAAAMANLDILDHEDLVDHARVAGEQLFDRLHDLRRHRFVGQVRGGRGLICAVEIVRDRITRERFPASAELGRRAERLMARHGLLGRGGNVFFVAPPLCITTDEIDHLVARLDDVFAELAVELGETGDRTS